VTNDPLLYDFKLPLRAVFYPLGFPLEIRTNSKEVLEAAQESWGQFKQGYAEKPLQIHIAVQGSASGECPSTLERRGQRNLVIRVADTANFTISDQQAGFSYGWLSPALIENRGWFRYEFLEAMAWDLLHSFYLTPIHAACVRMAECGVLLCGDSGAGKSSLAYACAREEWKFLSDDACCLVRKLNTRTVVGNPYQIRFRDSAVELFPELKNREITRRAGGKLSIELPTSGIPGIKTITESSVDYIVFLKRGEFDPPRMVPIASKAAGDWFHQVINWGPRKMRKEQSGSLGQLLEAPTFELQYSDLGAAVAKLETLVRNDHRADAVRALAESCEHA